MTSTNVGRPDAPSDDQWGQERAVASNGAARRHRHGGGARRPRRLTASRIALLVVLVLSAGMVGLHIHSYRLLSVYDEPQHIDYTYRLLHGDVPASGDLWLPPTIAAVACRGIDYPMDKYPPCGGPATRDVLPNTGLTTAFIHTPAYYLTPAAAVWAAAHLLPVHLDEISVMRATGALWLGLALVLLWLLFSDLEVPWLTRAGLSLALVATPSVLLAQSTVTNDATALAAGAAVCLATLRWDARRSPLWVPVVVGLVAMLLKVTSLGVLLMACAFVLVRSLQRSASVPQRWRAVVTRDRLAFVGWLAFAAAAVAGGWSLVQGMRATLDQRLIPQNAAMIHDHFQLSWLPSSMLSMVFPLQPDFFQTVLRGEVGTIAQNMANVGLICLAVVGAVRSRPGSVVRALAIATAVAALAFGPILNVMYYVTIQNHFGIPARYAFSLLPAMAALAGTAVRSRPGQIAVASVGVVMYAAVAIQLVR